MSFHLKPLDVNMYIFPGFSASVCVQGATLTRLQVLICIRGGTSLKPSAPTNSVLFNVLLSWFPKHLSFVCLVIIMNQCFLDVLT